MENITQNNEKKGEKMFHKVKKHQGYPTLNKCCEMFKIIIVSIGIFCDIQFYANILNCPSQSNGQNVNKW